MSADANNVPHKIAFIGDYLPRMCGIATFTSDLCCSVAERFEGLHCFVLPVTDTREGYNYPSEVRFEIIEQDINSYKRAADFLNTSNVDIVCLQHEYGIYGGPAGSHILTLLRHLRVPVVTTLHTVLRDPNEQQRLVMDQLAMLSDRLIVMTQKAVEFLHETYHIDDSKIILIPHGIPDVPFVDPNFYKDEFGVEGKFVILTFGLLSPDKGIEYVLHALPSVIARHPNVVYMILGATHPAILRNDGETYRISLQYLSEMLGIEQNVIFHNRFVTIDELKEFIGAADLYITPYLKENQITSGTLSYSFGMGKAVISTPYWHATELLNDGRGRLVPFRNSDAIGESIHYMIENEAERHAMRKTAYMASREMIWPVVADRYMALFADVRNRRGPISQLRFGHVAYEEQRRDLPRLRLDHLYRMTDSTGIIQHASYSIPNLKEGYCSDDNARALVLAAMLEDLGEMKPDDIMPLATTYLAFINYATISETARFHNFMSYSREWKDTTGTENEDSHGRILWALGTCIGRFIQIGFQNLAGQLFERALAPVLEFTSPRAWAFTLLGIHEYFRRFEGDRLVNNARETLAQRLLELYKRHKTNDWNWFESKATYANARLSHALILSGRWLANNEMLDAGLESLRWLAKVQTSELNCFSPIGTNGFYEQGKPKPHFDQQPIEAYTMTAACLEAYRTTLDKAWFGEARKAFEWFLGRNDLGLPIYDSKTGGCRDGLHSDRVNQNQGAESTLVFLLALVEMKIMENVISNFQEPLK